MTKKDLSQLYYLKKEIEQQQNRLQKLEDIATNIGNSTSVGKIQNNETSDKIGKYAAEIADIKSLLELNIKKHFYELRSLERYIQSLEDSEIRIILTLRYIQCLSWQQIARSMGTAGDGSTERKKIDRYLKLSRNSRKNVVQ